MAMIHDDRPPHTDQFQYLNVFCDFILLIILVTPLTALADTFDMC